MPALGVLYHATEAPPTPRGPALAPRGCDQNKGRRQRSCPGSMAPRALRTANDRVRLIAPGRKAGDPMIGSARCVRIMCHNPTPEVVGVLQPADCSRPVIGLAAPPFLL